LKKQSQKLQMLYDKNENKKEKRAIQKGKLSWVC